METYYNESQFGLLFYEEDFVQYYLLRRLLANRLWMFGVEQNCFVRYVEHLEYECQSIWLPEENVSGKF